MLVTEIQRFCMHDGPGLRTVVFLSGCPLHCAWCHNPETQTDKPVLLYTSSRCIGCGLCASVCPNGVHHFTPDHTLDRKACIACGKCCSVCPPHALRLSAREMTVQEIVDAVMRDAAFYGETGGVTLSGGEPLFHLDDALTLLRALKESGLHTAVETSGFFDGRKLEALMRWTDLFLWDVKDTDSARHQRWTGRPLEPALENLRRADACGAAICLRCILVRGINMDDAHLVSLARLYQSLQHVQGITFLPCHMLSSSKYAELGRACALDRQAACPPELLEAAEKTFWTHVQQMPGM
jgi:glycyl-radical enzyme activating protein